MMILLSAVSISASVWVLWMLHRASSQFDRMEADMNRLIETMRP